MRLTPRAGILVFAMALGTACTNPFATGTPETPQGSLVEYPQPTSPENVLRTLELALAARDNPAYLERIASTFEFVPDPVQSQEDSFTSFPDIWTREHEEVFLAGLLSNTDSLGLAWTDILTAPESGGTSVEADYELRVWMRGGDIARYAGRANMRMSQSAGLWSVETWHDVVVGSEAATWGLLRAMLVGSG